MKNYKIKEPENKKPEDIYEETFFGEDGEIDFIAMNSGEIIYKLIQLWESIPKENQNQKMLEYICGDLLRGNIFNEDKSILKNFKKIILEKINANEKQER